MHHNTYSGPLNLQRDSCNLHGYCGIVFTTHQFISGWGIIPRNPKQLSETEKEREIIYPFIPIGKHGHLHTLGLEREQFFLTAPEQCLHP